MAATISNVEPKGFLSIMTTVSSREIALQAKSLAAHISGLEYEAAELSLHAVSGNADAARRLAEIRKEIERANGDRDVLELAGKAAIEREAQAEEKSDAEELAAALAEAQSHARSITTLAEKADCIIADFCTLVDEIDAVERAAHLALRRSGLHNPGFVGSNGLVEHVLSRLDLHVLGKRYSDKRSVAEIAASAWRFLLQIKTDELENA